MRIAINGYGRVGRCVLRAALSRLDCATLQFVAVNELADVESIVYLTRYDSTHGRLPGELELREGSMLLQGTAGSWDVALLNQPDVGRLPWKKKDIDLVLDCSGELATPDEASQHIQAGAARVLLSQPGQPDIPAVVYGVNHHQLNTSLQSARVISAASCTSNALIPCLAVLQECFGVENGVITTIHASMHDQPVIDAYHSSDLRKNRAALSSIIPVDTALAAGVGRIIPEMQGRFVAHALRVPVSNVSALNITVNLNTDINADLVNEALRQASQQSMAGVLGYTEEPLASCDYNGDARSAVVDARQTKVSGSRTVNLLVWFDNEWAFANRMLDIALCMSGNN